MKEPTGTPGSVRFGAFQADVSSGELRKHGLRLKLPDQSFQVLAMLLERPRQVVTREELHKKLWPTDTFVDFDHGLNNAMNRLREALGDTADAPHFIETLPRRGYRFIAQVEGLAGSASPAASPAQIPTDRHTRSAVTALVDAVLEAHQARRRWHIGAAVAAVVLVVVVVGFAVRGVRDRLFGKPSAAPKIQSIAVLPLENLSKDPEQEYFADGMTEVLITDLGKVGALRVISRTSVMQYKGTKKSLQEIARELQVDALVEGTVARSGDRVRITANLVQASPEKHVWAESYARDLRDVLALQEEVARAIANEIKIKLSPQEQTRLVSARPVNPEAYEAYLRGRYEWNKLTRENVEKSIEYFQQALQKDPAYAQAWAGLSDAYDRAAKLGPLQMALPKAKAAALKALELDETLSEAHVSLGDVMRDLEHSWSAAEKEYGRAITLDPNNALAHVEYGYYLTAMGRLDEAIGEMKRARELDPLHPSIHFSSARAFYAAGRYDEALQQYREYAALGGILNPRTHRWIAPVYERKGMQREALTELLAAMRLDGENELAALVEQKYRSSGYSEAKKTFFRGDILEQEKKTGREPPLWIAADYAALGEKDKAFEWLDKASRRRNPNLIFLKTDDRFGVLRSDPRFRDLLRRMGLPP